MGSWSLQIVDYGERSCDKKGCKNLANQYRVTVNNKTAKVKKYCWKHFDLLKDEATD